jgi:hypothetical protein|nr:MAG TPA: hypothetical protein [Caudoviricetes sp.]
MGGSKDGSIIGGAKKTVEARYIEGRGWNRGRYDTEVLEATTDGKGNLTFDYAQPDSREKTGKTNKTNYLTYNVQAGAVDGKSFGINWDKVQSVSGQTYNLRAEAKAHGLSWDGATKSWRRKK